MLIPGVLQFRVIFNSGAAFSIGAGMTIVFTIVAAAVVVRHPADRAQPAQPAVGDHAWACCSAGRSAT